MKYHTFTVKNIRYTQKQKVYREWNKSSLKEAYMMRISIHCVRCTYAELVAPHGPICIKETVKTHTLNDLTTHTKINKRIFHDSR